MSHNPTEEQGRFEQPEESAQVVVVQIALTVRPGNQQAVIDAIRSAGDPGQVPGLLSVNLLRSLDGTRVINQMRWSRREAYEQARAQLPLVRDTRAAVQRLVEGSTTTIYGEVRDAPED
jgi:hypothetical protein